MKDFYYADDTELMNVIFDRSVKISFLIKQTSHCHI